MEGLKNRFMPRKPLDPPPPSFGRPAPQPSPQYTYAAFPPLTIFSKGDVIADGFDILLPTPPPGAPSIQGPHPFALHDINEDDWRRFLEDLKIQGGLNGSDRLRSNLVPLALQVSTPIGFLLTRKMEKGAKSRKSGVVAELIDVWNQQFFGPRHMRVFLAKGVRIYNPPTQQPLQPADWQYLPQDVQGQQLHRVESWSSSSSSSSGYSSDSGGPRQQGYYGAPSPQQQAGYYGSSPQPQPGYRPGYQPAYQPGGGAYTQPQYSPTPPPPSRGDDRHSRRDAKHARRDEKRAWREERRELKRQDRDLYRQRKRERKHGRKSEKHEKFRLIIVPA
jgi:hypothetical protein